MSRTQLLFATIFAFYACTQLNAQLKVKDSNKKKQPEWLLQSGNGCVVTLGNGQTLTEAQDKAVDSAKSCILSIGVNTMLTDNNYFKSIEINRITAARIFAGSSFYNDINISKADDFYWEYQVDKKNQKENYVFYIKYAVDTLKLKKIVEEIALAELAASLDTVNSQISHCKTVDDYNKVWSKLMFLNSQFPDNVEQKATCEELMQKVEAVFKNIEIKEMMNIPGKLVVTLTLNDRAIISSLPPVVKLKCAKEINSEKQNEQWITNYDYSRCLGKPSDSISVEFENAYNKITKKFLADFNKERIEVKMSNTDIIISRDNSIKFYVSSLYKKNIILTRIVFRFNDINSIDTRLEQLLNGAGLYDIMFTLPPDFYKVKLEDAVRGELYYKSESTGQEGIYRFYNLKIKKQ